MIDMEENVFLIIDDIEIPDLEQDDYTAFEEELGVSDRMIYGRRVEELRATVWVVEVNFAAIDADTMSRLSVAFKASREHRLFFLPSTGGTELVTGTFHLTALPQPSLTRWTSPEEGPMWSGYTLRFEEIDGHD